MKGEKNNKKKDLFRAAKSRESRVLQKLGELMV
jgi:hypothetical protein